MKRKGLLVCMFMALATFAFSQAGLRGVVMSGAEALAGRIGMGPFSAGLGMATLTFPVDGQTGKLALQPVVSAELLQLHGPLVGRGWAGSAGVNLIYDARLKLQLEL